MDALNRRAWLDSPAGAQAMARVPLAAVDAWVLARFKRDPRSLPPPAPIELDQPANVAWAVHFLNHDAPIAIEGSGGELTTLARVAGVLKDHGLSEDVAFELMMWGSTWNERCDGPWPFEQLKVKVHNAYLYCQQNRPGAGTAESDFAGPSEYDDLPITAAPPKLTRSQQRKNYQQRKRRARAAAFVD
jgi:hypothetical protein